MATHSETTKRIVIPIIIILICWIIYQPGLSGDFLFDDHPNILNNKAIALDKLGIDEAKQVISSGTAGPLNRPIAMLSFALNHYVTGYDSFWFKATNLIIHCINGIGIFIFSYLLLNAYRIHKDNRIPTKYIYYLSAAVSFAWLIHPINLTSVLYVVQRMNSLAATFSLLGLILYTHGRTRQLRGESGAIPILCSLLIAMPLAALSKENGILLPALLTIVEITFFRFCAQRKVHTNTLISLHIAIITIPLAALSYLLISSPEHVLGGYVTRDYTLTERLLTQTRVIWFYISQIVTPINSQLGIYHDDILVSRNLISPKSTLAATAGLLIMLGVAITTLKRAPILAFGIMFFLVGHSLESTIFPLELVHEHRNYLPSFGLLFTLLFYVSHPLAYTDSLRIRQACTFLLIMVFAFITSFRVYMWSDPVTHITYEADNHPYSPRANLEIGQMYMRMGLSDEANSAIYLPAARHHFQTSSQLKKSFLGGLFASLALEAHLKNEIAQELIDNLINRLESQPFSSNTVNWIDYLTKCIAKNECKISHDTMHEIIQAAIANKTTLGRTKSELYTAASNYYFHTKDYESVLYLAAKASNAQPKNSRYRMNLANILLLLGRPDDASLELGEASLNDHYGVYKSEIDRLTSIIEEIQTKSHK